MDDALAAASDASSRTSCSQSVDGVDHTLLTVAISQAVSVLETRVDAIRHGLAWRGKRRPCHGMVIGG